MILSPVTKKKWRAIGSFSVMLLEAARVGFSVLIQVPVRKSDRFCKQ